MSDEIEIMEPPKGVSLIEEYNRILDEIMKAMGIPSALLKECRKRGRNDHLVCSRHAS